ncbi:protein cappuccino [Tetranychus urticae]|nr:protein cappuccino [Tetranychus urticae]
MESFLERGLKLQSEQEENLKECKEIFPELMEFFRWKPKTNKETEWCKDFFASWIPFCNDFKDIFNKEIMKKLKQEIDKMKKAVEEKQNRQKVSKEEKKKTSGLKARLAKKGLIHFSS